jgi:hypothetical protein
MKTVAAAVVVAALLLLAGSPAGAQATKVGIAVGPAVPATGIGGPVGPDVSVSAWLARPIRGPFEWRAEVGFVRLRMQVDSRLRCAAAGFYCDSHVGVTQVGGGLQFEPLAGILIAPYAYVTIGLYHVTPDAEVVDLVEGTVATSRSSSENSLGVALGSGVRFRLDGRWTVRAELRYSGFAYSPGTVNWASVITPALSISARF